MKNNPLLLIGAIVLVVAAATAALFARQLSGAEISEAKADWRGAIDTEKQRQARIADLSDRLNSLSDDEAGELSDLQLMREGNLASIKSGQAGFDQATRYRNYAMSAVVALFVVGGVLVQVGMRRRKTISRVPAAA